MFSYIKLVFLGIFQFFSKKIVQKFGGIKKSAYLCIAIKGKGPVAQLNRASDYGSEGYRFESCRGHSSNVK